MTRRAQHGGRAGQASRRAGRRRGLWDGAGERAKLGATMREFVGLAWSNGLIPPQRIMASEIERNLLPRYETRLDRFSVGWDYSRVQALQEDEGTRLQRYDMGVRGGWVKVSEARAAMNLPDDAGR